MRLRHDIKVLLRLRLLLLIIFFSAAAQIHPKKTLATATILVVAVEDEEKVSSAADFPPEQRPFKVSLQETGEAIISIPFCNYAAFIYDASPVPSS